MAFRFWHSKLTEAPILVPAIGLELRVRLPDTAADEAVSIMECINAPGFGPPMHRHPETEIFRVLEGRYLYEIDCKRLIAEAGDVVSVPGGAVHAFRNITDKPASQLVMIVPGLDVVAFFTGLGEMMKDGVPDKFVLNAFSKRWQIEFLGRPITGE